ncbi:MAG: macro domain-containing protein [Anaerolineae bacterium]|nr:macro domain-containing protein [Anaerolineae bacterium]
MITYVFDDMFYSPARVLVNPVNTVGTMGTWLSKDFKRFFPTMFLAYQELCQTDRFDVGNLMLFRGAHRWVLNLPVKRHFRASITPDNIEAGLKKFAAIYATYDITLISFPALGYDQPGLDWNAEIRPLMEAYLRPLPIMVYLHMPATNGDDEKTRNMRAIRNWLNSPHGDVDFEAFWAQLTKRLQKTDQLQSTVSNGEAPVSFRVKAEGGQDNQTRASLRILVGDERPIFVPETSLRDLWAYVKRAGYALPQNFPAGLDQYGAYLIPILALLDTVRPVKLALRANESLPGLHYVRPLASQDRTRQVTATLIRSSTDSKPPTESKPPTQTKPVTETKLSAVSRSATDSKPPTESKPPAGAVRPSVSKVPTETNLPAVSTPSTDSKPPEAGKPTTSTPNPSA